MPKKHPQTEFSVLRPELFQVCLGVLLGDATLQKNTSKTTCKHRLKFLQGALHRHGEYLLHLHQIFKPFVISPPFHHVERNTLAFCTVFHSQFNCLAPIFFSRGQKKNVGEYFEKNPLTPITLAYWFMDDGGLLSYNRDYPRRAMVYNTQGFTLAECEILQNNLNKEYNLDSWLKADNKNHIIVIPAHRADYLREIITPHVLKSMQHKLRVTKTVAGVQQP